MLSPIDYGNFRTQFLLVSTEKELPSDLPAGWNVVDLNFCILAHGPDLPVLHHEDRCILGWPIDLESSDGTVATKTLGQERVDWLLEGLAGRYLLLDFKDSTTPFLHPDPGGCLSAFHHVELGILASTPALIESVFPDLSVKRSGKELQVLTQLTEESGTWYPAGLCHLSLWSLLRPNFRTPLIASATNPPQRTWPTILKGKTAIKAADIADLLALTLRQIGSLAPLEIPLSAGRDSRLLLACSRDRKTETRYSVHSPIAPHRAPEVEVSSALAEVLDLDHYVDQPRDPNRILCMGYGGEIMRGHYASDDDGSPEPMRLLGFNNVSDADFVRDALDNWKTGLSDVPIEYHADLIYLEQRMATTMSAALYRDDLDCQFAVAPICSRRLYDWVFCLPQNYRVGCSLSDDIFRHAWPATRLVPLQKTYFTGREKLRTLFDLVTAPFRGPDFRRAWRSKKLRKMLASTAPQA